MSTIRQLFSSTRPIDRPIEKVIDYAVEDDQRLRREIDEYEVTENVEACFRKFLEHFGTGVRTGDVTETGIWVSGFYGSGKSSFTKYLGFALDPNRKITGKPFMYLAPPGRTLLISDVPNASPTASSHPQVCQC